MDIDSVAKQAKISIPLATALVEGISKSDLELLISSEFGIPFDNTAKIDLTRMNLIGQVRGSGFEVTGGRNGRSLPYKVIGLKTPQIVETADQWTGAPRHTLDWIHSFAQLTSFDGSKIRHLLETRTDHTHENTFLYLWCYELARDKGWLISSGDEYVVVIQKFDTQPRFRLFNLNMSTRRLLDLARIIGQASVRPVSIVNITLQNQHDLRQNKQLGYLSPRKQAVYRTSDIVNTPRAFWSNNSYRRLRQRLDDTALHHACEDTTDLRSVIDQWKASLQDRHRQLAIGRDYISVDVDYPPKLTLIGTRDDHTVSLRVMEQHSNDPLWASELTGKDLNYGTQRGGKTGTSDWMIYKQARYLQGLGVEYLNVGADSGEGGLWLHKLRFTRPDDIVTSWTFVTHWQKETC